MEVMETSVEFDGDYSLGGFKDEPEFHEENSNFSMKDCQEHSFSNGHSTVATEEHAIPSGAEESSHHYCNDNGDVALERDWVPGHEALDQLGQKKAAGIEIVRRFL